MSILLEDVVKGFEDKPVLEGVSLEVREGEALAVIGASGSGKSVLLKTIVGLLVPESGRVTVDDQVVHELSKEDLYALRRQVGYVFQFAALFDSMTVEENLTMGLKRMRGVSEEEMRDRSQEALGLVELEGYGDRYPAELSGGQRKRVGLARAIVTHPKYLLYDEPTTGLDPVTTAVIDRLMMKLDEELDVTSVVVTHDMKSAYRVADRVAMLHEGRIRYVGTPDEIQQVEDPVVKGFIEGRPELVQEATA